MYTFLGILTGVRSRGAVGVSTGGLPEVDEDVGESCVHVEAEDEDEEDGWDGGDQLEGFEAVLEADGWFLV